MLAKEFIVKSGLINKIKVLEGDAINVMPQLKKKYDLIFLDVDKEDYKRLFDYSLVLLRKGGIMVVDNLLWHGYAVSTRASFSNTKNQHIIFVNSIRYL
jgi:predicted O-methyltransferase YrrM